MARPIKSGPTPDLAAKALDNKPLIVYPNPSHGSGTALFKTASQGQVTLNIYNLAMDRVASQELGDLAPGIHQQSLKADGLASGVYVVQLLLKTPGGTQSVGLFKWALVK